MVLSYFQQSRPDCKIESNVTTGRQTKIDCFSVDVIFYHCNTVFEAMGSYFHYFRCQEACPSLTDDEVMRGIKRENKTKCARKIHNRKDTKIIKMWVCNWWKLYRTDAPVKSYLRATFPYKPPLSEEQILQGIIDGRLFGYVQSDIEVSGHLLLERFTNFQNILL